MDRTDTADETPGEFRRRWSLEQPGDQTWQGRIIFVIFASLRVLERQSYLLSLIAMLVRLILDVSLVFHRCTNLGVEYHLSQFTHTGVSALGVFSLGSTEFSQMVFNHESILHPLRCRFTYFTIFNGFQDQLRPIELCLRSSNHGTDRYHDQRLSTGIFPSVGQGNVSNLVGPMRFDQRSRSSLST